MPGPSFNLGGDNVGVLDRQLQPARGHRNRSPAV